MVIYRITSLLGQQYAILAWMSTIKVLLKDRCHKLFTIYGAAIWEMPPAHISDEALGLL